MFCEKRGLRRLLAVGFIKVSERGCMFAAHAVTRFFPLAQNLTATADGQVLTEVLEGRLSLETTTVLECQELKYCAVIAKVTWATFSTTRLAKPSSATRADQKTQQEKDSASTLYL